MVGFFGLVSDWVDLGLIVYLADHFHDATFVIMGRSEVSLESVASL